MSPKFQQSQTGFGMATDFGGVGMKRAAPADEGDGADDEVKMAADEGGADDEADEVKRANLQTFLLAKSPII